MLHSGAVPFRRKAQSHYHDYRWEDAAEKHRSALRTGPIQASGAVPAQGIAQQQPGLGSLRRRAVPDAWLALSSRWLG